MLTSGLRTLVRATSLSRGVTARSVLTLAALAAVAAGVAPSMTADSGARRDWLMIGHDVENTRSQPAESGIDRRDVSRLAPKWVLTTAGDVSATPAVGVHRRRNAGGDGHQRGNRKDGTGGDSSRQRGCPDQCSQSSGQHVPALLGDGVRVT